MFFHSWRKTERRHINKKNKKTKKPVSRWYRPWLESLEERAVPSTFTVSNLDGGVSNGSLQFEVFMASKGSNNLVNFSVDGTISVTDPVGITGSGLTIDGSGHNVVIDGGSNSAGFGLVLLNGNVTVENLTVQNFKKNGAGIGIAISPKMDMTANPGSNLITNDTIAGNDTGVAVASGSSNTVSSCTITGNGTGVALATDSNTVGVSGSGNVISGNSMAGVAIGNNTGNVVAFNFVGLNNAGDAANANGNGVVVAGSGNSIHNNTISGNTTAGVVLAAGGNTVTGNFIGLNNAGTAAVANGIGVLINTSNEAIGGNTISGNTNAGVSISGDNNSVQDCFIGLNNAGTAAVANAIGVAIGSGTGNTIGAMGHINTISGNTTAGVAVTSNGNTVAFNFIGLNAAGTGAVANGIGVFVMADNTSVHNDDISGNTNAGVVIMGSNNTVSGNFIGTNSAGTGAVANNIGVLISSGSGNEIGKNNTISGNTAAGVSLGGSGNTVDGNFIGLNNAGTAAVANGIGVVVSASGNTIGGTTAATRNVISGNTTAGISLSATSAVEGNFIGTNPAGTGAIANGIGVLVSTNGATIGGTAAGAGNLISGNTNNGVFISGNNNLVEGNFIGTDVSGTGAVANAIGVAIATGTGNTIGGTAGGAGNLISGNTTAGISIGSDDNVVQGNFIGTNGAGTGAVANGIGIVVSSTGNTIGGPATAARNLISGNTNAGISLSKGGNTVQGNLIGTNNAGTGAVANGIGVIVATSGETIGGTVAGARNVISGNTTTGVFIMGDNNTVAGNFIGTDINGTTAIANPIGVQIASGTGNTIGVAVPLGRNLISGNTTVGVSIGGDGNSVVNNLIGTNNTGTGVVANGIGVLVSGNSNAIGGTTANTANIISGNTTSGVSITGQMNVVEGNFIGTDINGTAALANGVGVTLSGNGNTVGGFIAAARNIISGNTNQGVLISADGNLVAHNFIGLDVNGAVLANGGTGVLIASGMNNIIGTTAGAGNVISGNTSGGVAVSGNGNFVEGNFIGTDPTGTIALGNGAMGSGVVVSGANNVIGGSTASGNLISGNAAAGVAISGNSATGNVVAGNLIGTDVNGTAKLGNMIGVILSADSNQVGGTTAGARNIISGNTANGVFITGNTNVVEGNFIGTDINGTTGLGNGVGGSGVLIFGGANNVIGGSVAGAGNLISGNDLTGVTISGAAATGNIVAGNLIGVDVTGDPPIPNGIGVFISASGNIVGGTTALARNIISGNTNNGVVITGNTNVVEGNFIGTDITGTIALGNGAAGNGVQIAGGASNVIGGTVAGAGNLISGNKAGGVSIAGAGATGNLVAGNLIGTNLAGTAALGNATGVIITSPSNIVGGTIALARNIISGNAANGVVITSDGNVVEGNFIGTDLTGSIALGNGPAGNGVIDIGGANNVIGGSVAGAGNVISGNLASGVTISGATATGNLVEGNFIGTNAAGTGGLGNGFNGVVVTANSNIVGGTTALTRNVISANTGEGVLIQGNTNVVEGNFIGLDAAGAAALGNSDNGVLVFGSANFIGGTTAGSGNVISANHANGVFVAGSGNLIAANTIGLNAAGNAALGNTQNGVDVAAGTNNTIVSNVISANGLNGVLLLTGPNVVEGNFIGTDSSGTVGLGNGANGVNISNANGNTVGGTTPGTGNIISGNHANGVAIAGSLNLVAGNFIGLNAAGNAAIANLANGVVVTTGTANTIGFITAQGRNVISANGLDGVLLLAGPNFVEGNFIGTDATGSFGLGNTLNGVEIAGSNGNVIGGTVAGSRNTISGNHKNGVQIAGSNNLVQGNFIGTDATGDPAIGNFVNGVEIDSGSINLIGGTIVAARNIISGNGNDGVKLAGGSNNLVEGNFIGTDVTGTKPKGNGGAGIEVASNNNFIGGTVPGSGNLIAANGIGILITGSVNTVQGNVIGTNVAGNSALGNGEGIAIEGFGTNNLIGGTTPGAGNQISGNTKDGLLIAANGNIVQGNLIGTDSTGTAAVGNKTGIEINSGVNNTIGGTDPGARNIISGNTGDGIFLNSSEQNTILGNFIGTNISGKGALGNGGNGINVLSGEKNTIGGTTAAARNIISGNALDGILINSFNTLVEGNYIGTDVSGVLPLGNGTNGVAVLGGANNTVGGATIDGSNRIGFNHNDGVFASKTAIILAINNIFANVHLNIELF
jgi:hypothetical protein